MQVAGISESGYLESWIYGLYLQEQHSAVQETLVPHSEILAHPRYLALYSGLHLGLYLELAAVALAYLEQLCDQKK